MIANYHTHTARCRHAAGTEKEYVKNAIERGLKVFGFSDHTPQWFPGDYYSTMRMYPQQLGEYCQCVRDLQEQYKDQIHIPLGLEAEYYPALFDELLPRVRDAGVEYLILGQHWIGNEDQAPYSGSNAPAEEILQPYCRQVIQAMETGVFSYLAHPDLAVFEQDPRVYQKHMRQVVRAAKNTHTPLEINFLGILCSRHYPNPLFWEIVGEEGCPVVFGIDAHAPEHVLNTKTEEKAMQIVQTYGLQLLEQIPFKKI